ncbi:MAG: hypothetical protein HQK54_14620 [Oligoflexales bacterium]|nr:hypothetical protein [Oligoflexales bacterium]
MKKRLSNETWQIRVIILAILALMVILTFGFRSTSISGYLGLIEAEIPVLPISFEDKAYHNFVETPDAEITSTTPVVVLTAKRFYFGDVDAFSTRFFDVRNKFYIDHVEGAPDISSLISTMSKWFYQRMSEQKISERGILIFLPSEEIPMPIIIQTIAGLKSSPFFKRVILANGIG